MVIKRLVINETNLRETIHRLEPTDITALETLRYIYSQLKMMDKAMAIQDKIDALGG